MYPRIRPRNVYRAKTRYKTKKPIRGFRDLEIYQMAQQLAIEIIKTIQPFLAEKKYTSEEVFCEMALSIPMHIANAHTQRFDDAQKAIKTLEQVIVNCNNMIVFLEQIKQIYAEKPDESIIDKNNKNRASQNLVIRSAHNNKPEKTSTDLTETHNVFMLCEELVNTYNRVRIKTVNLLKAWRRWQSEDKK
ncbi:four helix bundle protein [Patescibacteria group bacterium AH-259-L07]|nr:four helix bundle protein [Patescibacteria group bacterium AH-259-L07]